MLSSLMDPLVPLDTGGETGVWAPVVLLEWMKCIHEISVVFNIIFSGESIRIMAPEKTCPWLQRWGISAPWRAWYSRDTVIGASTVRMWQRWTFTGRHLFVHIPSAAAINRLYSNRCHICCPVNRDSGSQVRRVPSASGSWRRCFLCGGGPVRLRLS